MAGAVSSSGRSSCPQCRAVFRGGFLRCPHDGSVLSTANVDPLVGTTLAGRYVVESVIGGPPRTAGWAVGRPLQPDLPIGTAPGQRVRLVGPGGIRV